jgi:hypothetical protein
MGEHRPRAHVILTEVSRVSRVLRCSQNGRASAPGCPQTRRLTPCEGFPPVPDSPGAPERIAGAGSSVCP